MYQSLVLIDPVAVRLWGSPFVRHIRAHEAAFAGVPAYIHEATVNAYLQGAASRTLATDTLRIYSSLGWAK